MPQLYYTTCLMYITTAVVCGIVRWFHMCHPYSIEEDYFYPARRQVACSYVLVLTQLPYLIAPCSDGVWLYMRMWGVLFYGIVFIVTLYKYFFKSILEQLFHRLLLASASVALLALMTVSLLDGDILFRHSHQILGIGSLLGIVLTIELIRGLINLIKIIRRHNEEEFSNEDDFPQHFACRIMLLPLLAMGLMWVLFFTGSRNLKSCIDLIAVVLQVFLLIVILYPQRTREVRIIEQNSTLKMKSQIQEQLTDNENKVQRNSTYVLSEEKRKELLIRIYDVLYTQQVCRNAHLTQTELASLIYSNRTYLSMVCNDTFGGFCKMVNLFRLLTAKEYAQAHPGASQEEVALHSGFTSRQMYSYMSRKLEDSLPAFLSHYNQPEKPLGV